MEDITARVTLRKIIDEMKLTEVVMPDSPDELTVELKIGHKYLFNIGSIGQPRNGDPRASFAVIDTKNNTVTRYRLPYDISAAQNKIIDAGLPERLAIRLAAGQ